MGTAEPARGDKSPKAGTLWGDRKADVATGFLVQFVDGFSSPPHIHNVSYRGVVISGLVHNDDPNAEKMWMPPGSFWTQPKGESHITAAKGERNIAYIEIDEGPYLVMHSDEAFDSGERPINVDPSNIVWLSQSGMEDSSRAVKVSYLWGSLDDNQRYGAFIKIPQGFSGELKVEGSIFRAVIIEGLLKYEFPNIKDEKGVLEPGSYFDSKSKEVYMLSCLEEECILYIQTNGVFNIEDTTIGNSSSL